MIGSQSPERVNLIDEIKLTLSRGSLSPFEIANFKKRANALRSKDTDNAFAALGILACIEGDIDSCRSHHENSIKYAEAPSLQIANYANSMNYLGLFGEAIDLALRARKLDMTNMNALDIAIRSSFELGDEERYLQFTSEWKRQKREDHPSYAEYLDEVREANELTSCCMYGAMRAQGA